MTWKSWTVLGLLAVAPLLAQEFRSTITGRVTDPQQAVVPDVKVIATQVETGARYETISGAEGHYTLPFVPPGSYDIAAQVAGFKNYVRQGVRVSTNEPVGLDIQLEVGAAADTITVTAEASALETSTASTGQVIDTRNFENMPMNGRTPMSLAQLAFGVTSSANPQFVRPFDNKAPSAFSMGGAPVQTNELLLDGAPDNNASSQVAYNPPVDTVAEMKVQTFQADAAYGHTGGGTVDVVLKTGTNKLHGSASEFNNVSALNATPFFTNRAGQRKSITRYNQWGVTAGGPVYIPKLLDGRNRVFFLFAYEGVRDGLPQPAADTVPTAAERNGDFSQLLSLGANYQIYDPATGAQQGSRISRQPFPGNIIPASRLSPIAKNLLPYYPLPNNPTTADGSNNFQSHQVERNLFNNELIRTDFVISSRNKLFTTFRRNIRSSLQSFFDNIGGNATEANNWHIIDGNTFYRRNTGAMLDDVHTLSPTLLLNTRLNWTRFVEGYIHNADGFDFTTLGFPKPLLAAAPLVTMPEFVITGYRALASRNRTQQTPYDNFQLFSAVTKVAGSHILKFGAEGRVYRQSSLNYGRSSGSYTFGTQWTAGPLDNSSASPIGQGLAAFLLGMPTAGSWDMNATSSNQAGYLAVFLQDDFRVTHNLTLNLGLRFERNFPTTERYNRNVAGFDLTTANALTAAAAAAYNKAPIAEIPAGSFRAAGGLLFAGPDKRNFYETQTHYFSPRLGFAWTPAALGPNTAIRGGAGVFFFPIAISGINQSGFSQSTALVATNDGYLTPAVTLSNPFPSGIQQPSGSSLGLMTYAGQAVSFYNPSPVNPYSVRWVLNIQRQLPWKIVAQIGYEGNHAVHLAVNQPLNFVPRQYWSTLPTRDTATINSLTANVANPFAGLLPGTTMNGSTVQKQQLLQAFPQFPTVAENGMNPGSSYFQQFAVRFEKRFSGGFQTQANYQFSKLITEAELLNTFDTAMLKAISPDDRPHRLVLSLNYDLPFGKGKLLGNDANRVVKGIIGGWSVNGIYILQSGAPIAWGNLMYYGGALNLNPRSIDTPAFDINQFNRNSATQLQWNVRTFPTRFSNLRADKTNNIDFSLIKEMPLREGLRLQFRCELFNLLNHPIFSAPSTSATSSAFGTITGQANTPRVIQSGLRLRW